MKRPDTILISTPRSGLNWVRYCVEWFSRCKTPGRRRPIPEGLLSSQDYILCRTHDASSTRKADDIGTNDDRVYDDDGNPLFSKAVLILRNYKELFVRNIIATGKRKKVVIPDAFRRGKPFSLCPREMKQYISNIQGYDKFPGEKMFVYYEDLMTDFSHMLKILDFMGIEYDLSDFDLEEHKLKSLESYVHGSKEPHQQAQTSRDPLNFTFHSDKHLNPKQRQTLDNTFRNKLPILYDTYLSRYSEENLKGLSHV